MGIHKWRPDPNSPIAVARCQYSNFIVPRNELVKQMVYQGTGLVWTGLYVWKRFADKPNPAMMTPLLQADPKPIPMPIPDFQEAFNLMTSGGVPLLSTDSDDNAENIVVG